MHRFLKSVVRQSPFSKFTSRNSSSHARIFILAGEHSGDAIGQRLMVSLREKQPECMFSGVGGPKMESHGLKSVFPMSEINVLGLIELVASVPRIWKRMRETVRAAVSFNPDAIVTIDSKGFSFRFLKQIRYVYEKEGREPPVLIQYVAPSFWAWKQGEESLKRWAPVVDHMLCILPSEPATCQAHGIDASYVGHPVIDEMFDMEICPGDKVRFRERHSLPPLPWPRGGPVVALLPGSRSQEVYRLLPVMKAAMEAMATKQYFPSLHLLVPTVTNVHDSVCREVNSWHVPAVVVPTDELSVAEKYCVLAAADVAVCASGTAVMQLLVANVPSVVTYKCHPLTEFIIKKRAAVRHISLPNILLREDIIPETLFSECTPQNVEDNVRRLLALYDRQKETQAAATGRLLHHLGADFSDRTKSPSIRAAITVLQLIDRRRRLL